MLRSPSRVYWRRVHRTSQDGNTHGLLVWFGGSAGPEYRRGKPKATVATVGGEPFYDWDLTPVQGQLPLRNQEYNIKKKALD